MEEKWRLLDDLMTLAPHTLSWDSWAEMLCQRVRFASLRTDSGIF